jgi:hypothetical protein
LVRRSHNLPKISMREPALVINKVSPS